MLCAPRKNEERFNYSCNLLYRRIYLCLRSGHVFFQILVCKTICHSVSRLMLFCVSLVLILTQRSLDIEYAISATHICARNYPFLLLLFSNNWKLGLVDQKYFLRLLMGKQIYANWGQLSQTVAPLMKPIFWFSLHGFKSNSYGEKILMYCEKGLLTTKQTMNTFMQRSIKKDLLFKSVFQYGCYDANHEEVRIMIQKPLKDHKMKFIGTIIWTTAIRLSVHSLKSLKNVL